jgi:Flp pilus assembly protein TadG
MKRPAWIIQGESGIVAVEMVILAPILITLTFAIIQFGAIFFVHNHMLIAAREASRKLAVGEVNETQAEELAVNLARAYWNLNYTATATTPDPANPADTDVAVELSVPWAQATLVDILGLFTSGNLQIRVTMRQET